MMDISFVILSWNSARYITNCLDSINQSMQASSYDYEVFVVDNGSSDESTALIDDRKASFEGKLKPIFLECNTGTTYSRNLALKQATGRYLLVMDSDVELKDKTIDELVRVIESDQKIGLVAPRLLYGSGSLQKSTDQFPTIWRKLYRYLFLKKIERAENRSFDPGTPVPVDYAISAFWLFRREILETVGFLDESIFYAPEDVDYCLRIWKHGFKILFIPGVYAVHHAQEISRGFRLNKATFEHLKGLIYYFRKHRYLFRKPMFQQNDTT